MRNAETPDLVIRLARIAVQLTRVERWLGDSSRSLRLPKLTALESLIDGNGLTAEQLARSEGVTQPTILVTIEHLARRRLVARRRSRGNEQDRRVEATREGRRQLEQERKRLAQLLDGLTAQELGTIRKATKILESTITHLLSREAGATERTRDRLGIGNGSHER